jgi:hypothetical protein
LESASCDDPVLNRHVTASGKPKLASADNVEAVVRLCNFVGCLVHVIEDSIKNLHKDIEAALIAPDRIAMMVMTVEDWEAETNQWCIGVALQELSVGATNQKVDGFGEE